MYFETYSYVNQLRISFLCKEKQLKFLLDCKAEESENVIGDRISTIF